MSTNDGSKTTIVVRHRNLIFSCVVVFLAKAQREGCPTIILQDNGTKPADALEIKPFTQMHLARGLNQNLLIEGNVVFVHPNAHGGRLFYKEMYHLGLLPKRIISSSKTDESEHDQRARKLLMQLTYSM